VGSTSAIAAPDVSWVRFSNFVITSWGIADHKSGIELTIRKTFAKCSAGVFLDSSVRPAVNSGLDVSGCINRMAHRADKIRFESSSSSASRPNNTAFKEAVIKPFSRACLGCCKGPPRKTRSAASVWVGNKGDSISLTTRRNAALPCVGGRVSNAVIAVRK